MPIENQQTQTAQRSDFYSPLELAFYMVMIALIIVGLIAATTTWRVTTMELIGNDRLRITQSQWRGFFSTPPIDQAG